MATGSVFVDNHSQAVRLPAELRLPDHVREVDIRANGNELIISPSGEKWDSFFLGATKSVSDDFLSERLSQRLTEHDAL